MRAVHLSQPVWTSLQSSCCCLALAGEGSMMLGNGQAVVPPGFRFHPTDEELLYYYLRKKVCYEPIDLDVIREVDLNKLEPWDLKDRCRIGSGQQNEWYFFSRKDKKYPTGTRTNRATAAGFWKATGRDKAIHHSGYSRKMGMRKTLVFYIGRAPNGQKTDWIMHEYRLHDHDHTLTEIQDEGWVVCRVFKKKAVQRGFHEEEGWGGLPFSPGSSMHLPRLLSTETGASFAPPVASGNNDHVLQRFHGDWSLLDKLLASHQSLSQLFQDRDGQPVPVPVAGGGGEASCVPVPYLGCELGDLFGFSK